MGDARPMPRARRYLRLVAAVTAAGMVLGGLALAGVVPAALRVTAAAGELGGSADPLGRLLARLATRSVVRAADGSVLAVLHGDQDRFPDVIDAVTRTVLEDPAQAPATAPAR